MTNADLDALRRLQAQLQLGADGRRVTMADALRYAVNSATAALGGETAPAGPEPTAGAPFRLIGRERQKVEAE